jgi:trimeric autotransporter adhesin
MGTFSDGTTQNLTGTVTWTSSNGSVATINNNGLATGLAVGDSTVQAAAGSIAGSAALTVTPATLSSIAVTPANPSIPDGTTQEFKATGTYTDGSTQDVTTVVSWSSSNLVVATINRTGLATGVGPGGSTIQASSAGVNGFATLTVASPPISVSVSPATLELQAGSGSQQFTATVVNDPRNNGVTWTLSGVGCVGTACGTLSAGTSASGEAITYNPPVAVPAPATVTLLATSVSDATRSASAMISVNPATTPVGSSFTESFGDSSSLCWSGGPSSCGQTWVAQDSAQSIVATPGPFPPDAAGLHSLQMVQPSGTRAYIYTTGSFPRIPAGTSFDLYFTLDVTSQAMSTYDLTTLIAPSNDASGSEYPAQISFAYDGTNFQLQAGGSSFASQVNISLNAWHTVQLHVASGMNASFIAVDDGAPAGFTANASDFSYLVVGSTLGNLDAITYYIGNIYVNSSLGGGPPPSAYIDFEASTDGTIATTDILAASTHCGNGLWSLTPTTLTGLTISTDAQQLLPSPVTTCGTQYTDAGSTRGLRYDISQTNQYAAYTWLTPSTSASAGFFFKITVSDQNFYSVFGITAGAGDYAVLHIQGGMMSLETSSGVSDPIPISPNVWYWITMQYNAGGTHYMQVYDTTTWSLLGSVSRAATGNFAPEGIAIGRPGGETGYPLGYWYYDNIVIDYLTAQFPILPGSY